MHATGEPNLKVSNSTDYHKPLSITDKNKLQAAVVYEKSNLEALLESQLASYCCW